jgi:uncharacterized glyoxalase superfamily protein PhnB
MQRYNRLRVYAGIGRLAERKRRFKDKALHQQLVERGVTITQGLADGPFGKTFTFRDPDGHLITVHDGG